MKTLNALKLRIMTRAFRIRIANGEDFADIAADYPALRPTTWKPSAKR